MLAAAAASTTTKHTPPTTNDCSNGSSCRATSGANSSSDTAGDASLMAHRGYLISTERIAAYARLDAQHSDDVLLVAHADGVALQQQLNAAQRDGQNPRRGIGIVGRQQEGSEDVLGPEQGRGGMHLGRVRRGPPNGRHVLRLTRAEGEDGPLRRLLRAPRLESRQ